MSEAAIVASTGQRRLTSGSSIQDVLPTGWTDQGAVAESVAKVHVVADANGRLSVLKLFLDDERGFTEEVRARMVLPRHPNILPLWDSGRTDTGAAFVLMPYEDNGSLHQRLDSEGPLRRDEALKLALGLVSAVVTAHEHGVVHGDIKAANVLVGFGDQLILTDFSAACSMTDPPLRPKTSASIAAPELRQGAGNTEASDIYALGVTLRQMVLGLGPERSRRSVEEDVTSGIEVISPAALLGGTGGRTRRPLLESSDPWIVLTRQMTAPEPSLRPDALEVLEQLCGMHADRGGACGAVVSCDLARHLRPAPTAAGVGGTNVAMVVRLLYLLSFTTTLALTVAMASILS